MERRTFTVFHPARPRRTVALNAMRTLLLFLPLLLALGCGSDEPPADPAEQTSADTLAAPTSPTEDFNSFFSRFASDSAFQISRVTLPLTVKLWDYSPTDSNLVLVELQREGWDFQRLSLDTNPATPGEEWIRETNVFGPDASVEHRNRETGSPITYLFRLTEQGWMLVQVVDATV